MKTPKEELNQKIDTTLNLVEWAGDYANTNDLFNVIRWAKQGLLQRKVDDETT